MRRWSWLCAASALLALSLAAGRGEGGRRADQDFEFADDGTAEARAGGGTARRPRRYLYDPHNPLCRPLQCARRESCLLRDAATALCANVRRLLRNGDMVLAASGEVGAAGAGSAGGGADGADDDDVFYDAAARDPPPPGNALDDVTDAPTPDGCVGCGHVSRAQFLCGSDNRTYSSLCRLDLHNCVRRARPVTLQCRGFCPCRTRREERRRRGRGRGGAGGGAGAAHNDVLPERDSGGNGDDVSGCALEALADRLLDWFSVLMDEAGAAPPPPHGFPRDCKPEVRWMFAHLDGDGDGLLSANDLYALRHDERERCLRPWLARCGGGEGGGEGEGEGVGRGAWCRCLRRAARPCTALARAHGARGGGGGGGGAYVPACDARGFYRPRQCHPALGVCWCVSPHGVELAGSRTRGAPACPPAGGAGGGEGGAPADDEDGAPAEGSGDVGPRF